MDVEANERYILKGDYYHVRFGNVIIAVFNSVSVLSSL